MSDTSEYSLQINFCFLFARHYIWGCRTCNRTPKLKIFLKTLQSRYKIESYKQLSTNNPTNKKWYPFVPLFNGNCKFNWQMYICSQVTSSRDGFPVVVYCLLTKAFRKEDCDQLTALNFKNILFCLESLPIFFISIFILFSCIYLVM